MIGAHPRKRRGNGTKSATPKFTRKHTQMSRKTKPSPQTLPLIRDSIIRDLTGSFATGIATQLEISHLIAPITTTLEEGDMWWVKPDMARLAQTAADTIPPSARFEDYMPSLGGICIWEKGITLTTGLHATGAIWLPVMGEIIASPLAQDYTLENLAWDTTEHENQEIKKLLTTTWLLATQENVGKIRDEKTRLRRHWIPKPEKGPRPEQQVHIVTLREAKPAQTPIDDTTEERGESWLTVRFLVRGHWRNQACGPRQSLRRPTWVAPYIKGPETAPIKPVKPTVKVWRR